MAARRTAPTISRPGRDATAAAAGRTSRATSSCWVRPPPHCQVRPSIGPSPLHPPPCWRSYLLSAGCHCSRAGGSLTEPPLLNCCPTCGPFLAAGLDDRPVTDIKEEDIKVAFRTAAMKWHPDKQVRRAYQCCAPGPNSATRLCPGADLWPGCAPGREGQGGAGGRDGEVQAVPGHSALSAGMAPWLHFPHPEALTAEAGGCG